MTTWFLGWRSPTEPRWPGRFSRELMSGLRTAWLHWTSQTRDTPSCVSHADSAGGGQRASKELGEDGGCHPGPGRAEDTRGGHQRGARAQRQVRSPPHSLLLLSALTGFTACDTRVTFTVQCLQCVTRACYSLFTVFTTCDTRVTLTVYSVYSV